MIALFGGTFDPIHNGHLHAARVLYQTLDFQSVHMLLAAYPPHRAAPIATPQQRWEMLTRACSGDDRLVPDDTELQRDGPSYTVDTVADVRQQIATLPLFWVMGLDAYLTLPSWHRWEELLGLCHVLVVKRPGANPVFDAEVGALTERYGVSELPTDAAGSVFFLEQTMLPVSSTSVRAAIAAGKSIAKLLPYSVASYIIEHEIYGG